MTQVLDELVALLKLEAKDANSFIGQSQDLGFRNVFGGQVLGQALAAATRTVSDRSVHSLHGYFLRPGDAKEPIRYEVDRIRDGKSFSTRRVVAMQFGRPIFNMSCSFQIHEPGHSERKRAHALCQRLGVGSSKMSRHGKQGPIGIPKLVIWGM